ncbi:MAG TPA: hypothetical protein VK969_05685 [Acidimicrobiia bacterium]|nr:hypothetical protein [Acidimicrobiia bacterium]
MSVVIDISDHRIKFVKNGTSLGDWSLDEVEFDLRPNAIYLKIDGEEIALKVADVTGFASAMNTRVKPAAPGASAPTATPAVADHTPPGKDLASRLHGIDPETHFEEIRLRIEELASDLADQSVSPPEVFGRWLRLLKEINVRHGQGAMPTPLFYRLNTRLLDLIPAPRRDPNPELQGAGPGPRI